MDRRQFAAVTGVNLGMSNITAPTRERHLAGNQYSLGNAFRHPRTRFNTGHGDGDTLPVVGSELYCAAPPRDSFGRRRRIQCPKPNPNWRSIHQEENMKGLRDLVGSVHHLAVFESAAHHESFTHAAEELCVTQPGRQPVGSGSRSGAWREPCFSRGHRSVTLTEEGQAPLPLRVRRVRAHARDRAAAPSTDPGVARDGHHLLGVRQLLDAAPALGLPSPPSRHRASSPDLRPVPGPERGTCRSGDLVGGRFVARLRLGAACKRGGVPHREPRVREGVEGQERSGIARGARGSFTSKSRSSRL